jgi:hypothetical protein
MIDRITLANRFLVHFTMNIELLNFSWKNDSHTAVFFFVLAWTITDYGLFDNKCVYIE